jgi:adenylate cyclase
VSLLADLPAEILNLVPGCRRDGKAPEPDRRAGFVAFAAGNDGTPRMRGVTRTLTGEELSAETGASLDRIQWMADIGVLKPDAPGTFRYGDVFRVKLISALADSGFERAHIEWAVSGGMLNLDHVDEYVPYESGPLSARSFTEFLATAGSRADLLPTVYEVLGLPRPDPSLPIHVDEESLLERFLEGWSPATSEEALIRAARLIAEGTRITTLGWAELLDEQIAAPARERLLGGEIDRFPVEATRAISTLVTLAPGMMEWLAARYLEQRSVGGIVVGFEQFLASRDLVPSKQPTAPPAIVFVDLSGYTRATEERGDQVAVGSATRLQREAHAIAASNDGRLVKLLGDGAMLRLPDADRGVAAAIELVGAMSDGELEAHAGVHAGPVIERDLDVFGRTVNLASRIAGAAGPGEVLVSGAVVESVDDPRIRFLPSDAAVLKGIPEPVPLFRALSTR